MKPAPFGLRRPTSLTEAVDLLTTHGEAARLIAGGQSLIPVLNMRLARPELLVDLTGVRGLDHLTADPGGGLRVGVLVRHSQLATSAVVAHHLPLLADAASHIGHRAIRNRGTLGGSLAHADPAAELPAVIRALDATLVILGRSGQRELSTDDFFSGYYTTAITPGEILTEVRFPDTRRCGWSFREVSRRPGDFAIAGVAVLLPPPAEGGPRLAAFGVGDTPVRLRQAEALLVADVTPMLATQVAAQAAAEIVPSDDLHASAAYRRQLIAVLVEQAVIEAANRRQQHAGG